MKRTNLLMSIMLLGTLGPIAGAQEMIHLTNNVFAPISMYKDFDLLRYEKNFIGSLRFPCDGIVESALRELAMIKLCQPTCCSEAIEEEIRQLAVEGATPSIRYKAQLASLLFDIPEMFMNEQLVSYKDAEQLFTALSRRLENQCLAEYVE